MHTTNTHNYTTPSRFGKRGRVIALLAAAGLVASACSGETEVKPVNSQADSPTTSVVAGDTAPDAGNTEVVEDTTTPVAYGGDLVVGLEAESTGLRPWDDTCSAPCYNMMTAVYDKLFEQTSDFDYEPYLATSATPNEDFTVWTVELREGVVFHNGVPFDASSVAAMFPIQQAGAQSSSIIATTQLASVEATDTYTVTYTFGAPFAPFPAVLARAPMGMVFEAGAASADADAFAMAPVGTGPFAIESRDLDNETRFTRNADYWGVDADGNQLPYLDSVAFRPIPDEGTRLDAFLSGTVDVFQTLRQGTIRDAREAAADGADVRLLEFQGSNVGGGMFNVAVAPYDDIRVRRGLVLMNSQEQVIEALGGTGISLPGTQWFSPDSPWWSEDVAAAWPTFDFDAGLASLNEYINDPARSDGKAVGENISVEISCPPDPTLTAAMQVLQQTYTSSGVVDVNLTSYDQQTHIDTALGMENGLVGTHGMHCWRWSSDDDPAVGVLTGLGMPPTAAAAEAIGMPGVVSPLNFPNYFNPSVFQAAAGATQTDDFETRKAMYESIMLQVANDLPIWYSGYTASMMGSHSNINGLLDWHTPSGSLGVGIPNAEGRWAEVYFAS